VPVFNYIMQGLTWGLNALHGITGSYILAIILLTAAIRLVLHPLTRKQLKSMKVMQALAPQIEVLRRKYKEDPKKLNAEVMNLYKANNANPVGGCLPLLLQFPILIALYRVIVNAGKFGGETLFGVALSQAPNKDVLLVHPVLLAIPILNGVVSYFQQQVSVTDPQQAKMFIFMPIFLAFMSLQFPLALSVYWISSTALYIVEYLIVVGRPKKVGVALPKEQRKATRTRTEGGAQQEP
jgi:YidC/Oxa1 family membrane protein insertase